LSLVAAKQRPETAFSGLPIWWHGRELDDGLNGKDVLAKVG
jgi:hypothetical protein